MLTKYNNNGYNNINTVAGSVVSIKPGDGVDGSAVCVGVATVLRQLSPRATPTFMALLAQYIAVQTHQARYLAIITLKLRNFHLHT